MRVGRNNLFHIGGLNLASQAENFEHIFADAEDQHPGSGAVVYTRRGPWYDGARPAAGPEVSSHPARGRRHLEPPESPSGRAPTRGRGGTP